MSVISQFFPTSGGGGGSATEIPVEILGMGGGGGAGSPVAPYSMSGGPGGAGGLFHTTNYSIEPGVTVPITIGSGGSYASCPCGAGGIGGSTCFNYPKIPIEVIGGGGGAKASQSCVACPGGNGGGGIAGGGSAQTFTSTAGSGIYHESTCSFSVVQFPSGSSCGGSFGFAISDSGKHQQHPWGIKSGYPGKPAIWCCSFPGYKVTAGSGGNGGGNGASYTLQCAGPTGIYNIPVVCGFSPNYYCSTISGQNVGYGETVGKGGSSGAGCPGAVIIKWSTIHGAAPSYPGATDISPQTPGYYTYCFTSSGSITLP